mgnify:CR=1 FL=1
MKHFVFLVFGFLTLFELAAQTNTLSPYSIYGLGDTPMSSTTANASMGHTGVATLNTTNVNSINPASLAYISKPSFVFDFRNEYLTLNNGNASQSNNILSIENFAFAFPLINDFKKRHKGGFSFGLQPYARQGYDVLSTEEIPGLGTAYYRFFGQGGINSAYLSASYDLIADSNRTNVLSLGARGAYVFGNTSRNRVTQFDSNTTATYLFRREEKEISSFDAQIGLVYSRKLYLKKGTDEERLDIVSAGVTYTPSMSFNTFIENTDYTYIGDYLTPIPLDTLFNENYRSSTVAPQRFAFGLSYIYNSQLTLSADVSQTQWSALEIDGKNAGLNDELTVGLGAELIPDHSSYKQLHKIIRYRAGINYSQTRLNVNGTQPVRIGVSTGVGIPILASRSTTIFNLGTEYAFRGTSGLAVSENFWNVYFGMIITPSQFDRWFVKRKYD